MSRDFIRDKEVKGQSPALKQAFASQLLCIMEAMNKGTYDRALRCIQTLVTVGPPKVQKECDVAISDYISDLKKIQDCKGVDAVHTITLQNKRINRFMSWSLHRLLRKVVNVFYENGYLEEYDNTPTGHELG